MAVGLAGSWRGARSAAWTTTWPAARNRTQLKSAQVIHRQRGRRTLKRSGHARRKRHGAERRRIRLRLHLEEAIEPTVRRRFNSGSAGLHIILSVEMRSRI